MAFYWDQQENPARDYPLAFRWRAPELAESLGFPPAPNAGYKLVRDTILAELTLAAEAGKPLSYSRRREFYKRSRYRHEAFTYTNMIRAVNEIVDHGIGIENRTKPNHRDWQSTLIATPALYDARPDILYSTGETIILRKRGKDGGTMEYIDTDQTRDFRKGVASVNEMLDSIKIGVPDGIRVGANHLQFGEQIIRTVPGNGGCRIFTDDWCLHGRFYCWPQNVPSTARTRMTVNNESVAELDYSAMHPTMLYCQVGERFDGDPYDVGGGFERHEVKLGMVIAINAKNIREAVSALARNAGIAKTRAFKIIEAILGRHKSIERAFCSDAGIRLMNQDSRIMINVVKGLMADGIPSVPVHDSIIVPARFEEQAKAKMRAGLETGFRAITTLSGYNIRPILQCKLTLRVLK